MYYIWEEKCMSLTIRANQGNAIAADNAGIKKNESAEQIKKRNVVDASRLDVMVVINRPHKSRVLKEDLNMYLCERCACKTECEYLKEAVKQTINVVYSPSIDEDEFVIQLRRVLERFKCECCVSALSNKRKILRGNKYE